MDDYSYCDRFADIDHAEIGKFANIASFLRINPGNHLAWRANQHDLPLGIPPGRRAGRRGILRLAPPRALPGRARHLDRARRRRAARQDGRNGRRHRAGAVVTKDVAPYTIVGGVPAAPLRRRFAEPLADRLMRLAWWDWDHARLRTALDDFRSLPVEAFLDKHGG